MRPLTAIMLLCATILLAEPVKSLKILSIGNSFSNNAHRYLAQIIQKHGKAEAVLGNASIGGCSLERHWNEHLKAEKDPEHKMYRYKNQKITLKDYLKAEKWDIVTIQQVSHMSFKPETFQPFADAIVALIKECAPQAKIYIHRTWAYRPDHKKFFQNPQLPGFTPEVMFRKSGAAYAELGKHVNAPLIPAGDAMWMANQTQPVKHVFPDPEFDYQKPVHPNLPKDTGALINGYSWRKDPKTQEYKLSFDGIHANKRGEYLIGCTWYAFLFRMPLDDMNWAPDGITPDDAKFLRSVAQKVAFDNLKNN